MNTWKKEGAFENFLNIIKGWDGFGSFTTCRGSLSFSVITFMKILAALAVTKSSYLFCYCGWSVWIGNCLTVSLHIRSFLYIDLHEINIKTN